MENPSPRKNVALMVGLSIFALALLLRLIGIGWGLKTEHRMQSLHPDEAVVYAYSQTIQPTQLQFDPGFYNYGTLYLTTVRVLSDVVAGYTGAPDPKSETSVWDFVSRVHYAGRLLSALAGASTALVVFLLCRRFLNLFGAAMGGMLVAVAPGHVVHSRFQTVDVLATFWLALSVLLALRLLPSTQLTEKDPAPKDLVKWSALAGLFAGLSAGTKYTGILAGIALIIVAILARRDQAAKLIGVGFGVALLAFVVSTPGVLLHTAKFMEDFRYEMEHTSTGHGIVFANTGSGFVYHLFINLFVGVGPILTILGLVGLGLAAAKKQAWVFPAIALFVLFYLLIGRAEVKFLRYTFPMIPFLAVGFAYLMAECHEKRGRWQIGIVLGIFALGGFPFGGLSTAGTMTSWMAAKDPRDVAADFLRKEAVGKTVGIVSDPWFYTPPLYPLTGQARVIPGSTMIGISGPGPRRETTLNTVNPQVLMSLPFGEDPFAWDVRLLDQKPDFITYSSFEAADPARLQRATGLPGDIQVQVDRYKAFQERLTKEYTLMIAIAPEGGSLVHDLQYIQPTVMIWRRNPVP